MMYLGTPGRMVEIKCPTQQRVQASDRYSFQQTLEGRVKAQVVPGQRRVWDVSTGSLTTPSEVATLQEFANGAWGRGPFWFVSTDAPVVNVLPPVATTGVRDVHVDGGPLRLDTGQWAPFSILNESTVVHVTTSADDVPVLPGRPVTGSAWVTGSNARVLLYWYDATGALLGTEASEAVSSLTVGIRAVVSAMPPAGAVTCRLVGSNVARLARPAITFTDEVFEYGDGQGCPKAVVHAVSRDVVKAWDDPRTGRWSELSFTVQEVG